MLPNWKSQFKPEDFRHLFQRLKAGYVPADRKQFFMAEAIKAHPEFEPYLEGKKIKLPPDMPDPFLHLTMHVVVEELLEENDPPEVSHFYSVQQGLGTSHHEIVHMLGAILTLQFFSVVKEIHYDYEAYRSMLRKYANYPPEQFWQILEGKND